MAGPISERYGPPAAPVTTEAHSGLAFLPATTAPSDEAVANARPPEFRDVDKSTETVQLSLLHEQYIKDYEALEKAEATLQAPMDSLSRPEFRLEEAQKQFTSSLTSPDFAQQVAAGMFRHRPKGSITIGVHRNRRQFERNRRPALISPLPSRPGQGQYPSQVEKEEHSASA